MEEKINDSLSLAQLLLDEFTHRLNNDLAAMIGIVSREQAMSSDERTGRVLKRVHARLVNLGRVQHALQGVDGASELDAADYLRELCESRRATLEDADVSFVGCPVRVDAARCRRLGMIVSELVENARKHAFSGASGAISVELRLLDGKIRCRVADNGRGFSGATHGRGLAIVRALARSLNGSITREPTTRGTAWLLSIPH